jgi:TonB-linked SusC/RagA family outer membrane protein
MKSFHKIQDGNTKESNMKKRNITHLIFLCLALYFAMVEASAQKQDKIVTINSVVVDKNHIPVKGAAIYGNEGSVTTSTDENGMFTITIREGSNLLIEADKFQSTVFKSGEYNNLKELQLEATDYLYGEGDDINIAFGKIKKGDLVNAVNSLDLEDILKYDNIQEISEALSGRMPGMLGSNNLRGIGSPLYIVDGLPRSVGTINLAEVEQITVLKDVNSAILYGCSGSNGVVLITTKRGQPYKKKINVTGFYGVSRPTALPEFLSSSEYATLYNEARVNDGLTPLYDEEAIANYTTGNRYRYPDVDYYSDTYLKPLKPFHRVTAELSGGNEVATYYSNMGWDQTGSLLDYGMGRTGKQNRFNIRGNVDMRINHRIKNSLDASAVFYTSKGMRGDYWSSAATLRPNLFAPLIPIALIDPENELLLSRKNDIDGLYLLGGTTNYQSNPIADGYSAGINQNIQRTVSFNDRIDFDLGGIVEGLALRTNVSFDFFTMYDQLINNTYSVYEPVWADNEDVITDLVQYGTDARTGTQVVQNSSYQRRFGVYGMLDYNRVFSGNHHVSGALIGYISRYKVFNDLQGNKNSNLGLRLGYSFKNRYLVDFSSAYVISAKLPEGNRGAFSPSLGLAWVVSSEDFMSGIASVDYLKLRVSAGIMNTDNGIGGFYYYDNNYGKSGSFSWYEGAWSNSGMSALNGANNNLFFEKRKEINFGFESSLFDSRLYVTSNIFFDRISDIITQPDTRYSSFYSDFVPYENHDANAYRGAELGLSYNQNIGKVSLTLGTNLLYYSSKVVIKDEVYANDYQYRTGRPVDALYGLVADGFFMDQDDIDNHELQVFSTVQPGDIKYVDQNGDGVVDSNDQIQVGRSTAPFSYGLNLKVNYGSFTLFVHGTGRLGADAFLDGNYYWVDGDDKYSAIVRDRWTEETKMTATYPRLSSSANTNNFRNSTFWLYSTDRFVLDRLQLTYDLNPALARKMKMQNLGFFVDGTRLVTISKNRDIMELNVGGEPYYRSYSVGVRAVF